MVTETQIKEKALELGFHGVGIASVDSQDSAVSHLKSW
ncbi:MAG: epoxyqueuosine reductase, partial [Microcystis aeruginosa]